MDSQHTVTQVYILGDESNIQKCVKQITGTTCDLQIVWTEIPAASLLEDGLYMECLKEVQMNNDKDLNNDTHVQAFDIDTQTYSSVDLKSNDNPSFSTTDAEQKERARKVDINAIVIEEETRINDDLASFIFTLFTWPALILLAIDSTTFNIERYKGFVKEMGVLASLEEAKSKLLLVDTNSEVDQEKIEGHFPSAIRKTYFTRHSHFEWCPVPEMCRKMKDMLKEMTISYANGPKSCKNMFASGQLFCPLKECDKKEIEWLVRKKQLILFKSNDEEFVCKPNMLINKLRSILAEMFNSVSSIDCILKLYRFYRYISITASKERLTDALIETGFIFVEDDSQNDTLYMLPFIYSNRMPAFDCIMYSPHANALRMTVKVDIIPSFVRGKMYTILFSKGWNILCSGPFNTQIKHSLIFCKKSHRLFVHFHVAKVYLLDLNTETSSNDTNIDREYQELRKSFENELKHLEKGPSNEKNLDCHFFKVRENQEIKSVIEEEGNEWENVFEENNGLVTRDVSPWFSTHIQKVERKIKNKTISSAFLAEVSNLFGKNTTLFFVGEGIPEPLLAQIEKNHKGEAKEATFEMLMEWKNQKGQAATIADLRTAIQKSSHVIVNLHEFDQIVLRLN
ncbi:uncharacterized protein LOC132753594 [Ruditapes philippinarum]|uniref:uncharacterized protein LOC132753594 n=1 Tax=Ruditapes philippinarum TaxID=129788 RepID=UPI00295B496A|nr:uncharacterized protein LOC132753594 [Ruditapes philippinarum]